MAGGFSTGGNYYKVTKTYSGSSALSASAWIYYPTAADYTIAGLWEDSGSKYQWLFFVSASNKLGSAIQNNNVIRLAEGGTLSTNSWQHVAFTFSNTDLLRTFINGSQVASAVVGTGGLNTQTDPFGLGARQAGNTQFSGNIAEFATWTVRLTAAQIASLAKGFAPPKVLKPDCYIPLVRNVQDEVSKYTITTVGTPTVQPHPRIYK